mmetsp:Transcript_24485/g.97153  ORF Transcript_24485/g.97153 Transcript_24485/m.97153 type:complete len:372 (-) Transcript_24485:990-2105(-)
MVGASELAFRLAARELGSVDVTWTAMLDAGGVAKSPAYRREQCAFDERDAPCVAQLGGRDPAAIEEAAAYLSAAHSSVRAVELNCGCPQRCARAGQYGAYLLDDPDHLCALVRALSRGIRRGAARRADGIVPAVAVKIRVYPTTCNRRRASDDDDTPAGDDSRVARTISLAMAIVEAGATLLTVHGRSRGERYDVPCAWGVIAAVTTALRDHLKNSSVLVVANGDVAAPSDARRCARLTRADGVMAARSLLADPARLAVGRGPPTCATEAARRALTNARTYLRYVAEVGAPWQAVTRHLAEMLQRELRRATAGASSASPKCFRTPLLSYRGSSSQQDLEVLYEALDDLETHLRTEVRGSSDGRAASSIVTQ